MPRKPLRGCAVPGWPNLVYDARTKKDQGGLKNVGGQENNSRDFFNRPEIYCEKHRKERQKEYELYQRKYNHRERYDGRWDKVRNIYIKNHPLCEECLKENITTVGELVHHKIPIEDGGEKYDFDNLETVCRSCHSKLHIKIKKEKISWTPKPAKRYELQRYEIMVRLNICFTMAFNFNLNRLNKF